MRRMYTGCLALLLFIIMLSACSKNSKISENMSSSTADKSLSKVTDRSYEVEAEDISSHSFMKDSFINSKNHKEEIKEIEIYVFVASSLNRVTQEIVKLYEEVQPNVHIMINSDSSGKLSTQIQEGYECDIFLSAAMKQMDEVEARGYLVQGTRKNLLKNHVVLIHRKDMKTQVTSLVELGKAKSIALAGASVPVGGYTREALIHLGILDKREDSLTITTREISNALGGVEISEQDNVSKVMMAVLEGSCEVGTVYYSDIYGYDDEIEILDELGYELTGEVAYPIACVRNIEADELQEKAAADFYKFILSDPAKDIFHSFYFKTDTK